MMKLPIRYKISYMGLILAFTLILSYVEILIPSFIPIPGFKLGIANLGVLICLQILGYKEAFTISLLKAIISSLLFGNTMVLLYSLSGAIFSCVAMIIIKKLKMFSVITISATGGIIHNLIQLGVCYFVYDSNGLVFFIPYLIIAGLVTGIIVGFIEINIEPYIKRIIKEI